MADGEVPDGTAGKLPAKQGGPTEIQTAWKILAGGAPVCAATLVDIAENGKSEIARVQASNAVLDRVGLATPKERPQVTFHVIPQEFGEKGIGAAQLSPAEVIRGRLAKLGQTMAADGTAAVAVAAAAAAVADGEAGADGWADWQTEDGGSGDDGIVDAEIVPDPADEDPWG